jgi:SAM-dependent methyltransferase
MPVTAEDVIWCYRTLLGRDPESEVAVRSRLDGADLKTLVLAFIGSQEFRDKFAQTHGIHLALPLDAPPLEIESTASKAQLAQLLARVRESWTHLGEVRPHHSVLTLEQFLPENLPTTEAEFWASGETEAASIEAMLTRFGVHDLAARVCVEYGCGLGRVTLPLARRCRQVHGYDISPNHLAGARRRAGELGVGNAEFHLVAKNFLADLEKCDFFYSKIVFQHNPPPIIRELIRIAVASLRPEGVAVFQIPVYHKDYHFRLAEYLARPPHLDMEMHCIPQSVVFHLIAEAGCAVLEVREEAWADGILSDTFVVRRGAAGGE